jgi:hypothetical protein
MSGVPYIFANATTSIPLSELDSNFATPVYIGNASVALGNTVTSIGNLTLTNTTISSTNGDANIHGLTVGLGAGSVSNNTAVGASALAANTSGASNTALGAQSLYSNTSASYNTAVGYEAGYTNVLGGANTFIGNSAGFSFAASSAGNTFNTFIGNGSGSSVTSGTNNTILGSFSGNQGGLNITTSSNNIVLSDGQGNVRAFSNGSGSWGFNTASPDSGAIITVQANSGGNGMSVKAGTNGNYGIYFNNVANSTQGGCIINSVGVVYSSLSDYRLKTVVNSISDSGTRIDALNPINFTWNVDGSSARGFLAHEFQAVYANSVNGSKDAVDEKGEPVYQVMEASSAEVIADLVAEIKSLRARLKAANIA